MQQGCVSCFREHPECGSESRGVPASSAVSPNMHADWARAVRGSPQVLSCFREDVSFETLKTRLPLPARARALPTFGGSGERVAFVRDPRYRCSVRAEPGAVRWDPGSEPLLADPRARSLHVSA